MAKESLTETGSDQHSSDAHDESLLDEQQNNQSADEQQEDTGSDDDTSNDSGQSDSSQAQEDESSAESSDDDGLKKFAKSQGFDPENLTDGERKALKIAHDNQKAFRNRDTKKDTQEFSKEVEDLHQPGQDEEFQQRMVREMNLLRAENATARFFNENPDAKDYADEMKEVLKNERAMYGDDAARALSQNLPRLYREARFARGDFSDAAAREAGRREEREERRRRQEGSSESGQATTQSASTPKVTRDWVRDTYIPGNPEHEKMLEQAMANGELS